MGEFLSRLQPDQSDPWLHLISVAHFEIWIELRHHIARGDFRAAQPGQQLIGTWQAIVFRRGLQRTICGLLIDFFKSYPGKFLSQFDKFLTVKFAQAAADGGFRPAGGDNINPASRRGLPLRGDNLHGLPIAQARPQRHANAVTRRALRPETVV